MKKRDKICTFLGRDTEFEGNLKFYGAIRVDGHFKGNIWGDGTLIVGEGAMIESDVHVSYLLNSGEIRGDVIADQKIEILAPGKILGNIQAPSMVINEGVIIEGNFRMHQGENTDEEKLTALSADKSLIDISSYSAG